MNFEIQCPKCGKSNKFETDTGLADNGDVYHDVAECEPGCGEVFMVRTTIKAETEVLAIAPAKQ